MIYNIRLRFIAFLATIHVVAKDLAFFSPLNDPPREIDGIHEVVAIKNHCPLEGQVEAKDYNTDIREVMSHHTQYKNHHGKNEQEIRSERVQHW